MRHQKVLALLILLPFSALVARAQEKRLVQYTSCQRTVATWVAQGDVEKLLNNLEKSDRCEDIKFRIALLLAFGGIDEDCEKSSKDSTRCDLACCRSLPSSKRQDCLIKTSDACSTRNQTCGDTLRGKNCLKSCNASFDNRCCEFLTGKKKQACIDRNTSPLKQCKLDCRP